MTWIYLSPHLDDIALSCGGLLWEQTQSSIRAEVWTLCAGDPPEGPFSAFAESLHARWQTDQQAAAARRAEDLASCMEMGAVSVHFSLPDCIYRLHPASGEPLYTTREAIFGPIHPIEAGLVDEVYQELSQKLPAGVDLVIPLTLGGHVDHRLARAAVEQLAYRRRTGSQPARGGGPAGEFRLWYYADYPYVLGDSGEERGVFSGLEPVIFAVSQAGLAAWQAAIWAHASQASTFWPDQAAQQAAMRAYWAQVGGVRLWRPAG